MLKEILLLVVTVLACQGSELVKNERHGNTNMYFVYTRDNPRLGISLPALPTPEIIAAGNWQSRSITAIVVHGHEGTGFNSLNPVVKNAFLEGHDINVIVVDWSIYSTQRYSVAVNAVPSVGLHLAQFIQTLVDLNVVSFDRLHLVGFNLGAHVVGIAGRSLNGQVARITGLDPSNSQWGSNSQRLRNSDARYVEVIHTDGDLLGNGIGTAIGHVDIFANGGSNQPGCLTHSCSHNRAWELFAASLKSDHLVGNLCNSNLQLTMNLCRGQSLPLGNNEMDKLASGIFRANTGRRDPF